MSKSFKRTILSALSLFILTIFIGCGNKNNSKTTFDIEQFQNEMISKNYNFIMQEVEQHFLPATRKRVQLENEVLDIYIFRNNKTMEIESKFISSDGYGYDNGSKFISIVPY